jgi:hypothetical protein
MPSYQLIFFIMALVCATPVLIWYYRRHSHPKFRPTLGEMAMVSLFAVLLSLGGSLLLGGLMDDPDQFSPESGMGSVSIGGGGAEEEAGGAGESRDKSSSRKEGGSRNRSGSGDGSSGSDRR